MRKATLTRINGSKANLSKIERSPKQRVKGKEGTTPKQEMFIHHLVAGQPLAAAYRLAFDTTNMQDSRIYTEASRLLDRPVIVARLQALMADRSRKMMAADAKFIRQHVLDRLMIESLESSSTAAARIKALELLGRVDVVGMFTEKVQIESTVRRDPKQIEEEIKAKLQSYLDGLNVVNVGQSGQ